MEALTFGSLFAGIGGLDLGFERAGLTCRWQVEIDPYARSVLAKHWPNIYRWDDVRTWPQPTTEKVDVICGGFPCQDISYAGKGAGIHGERSGLWFEFARVVREMGPRFVVVENVAALLTRGLGEVLGTLASIGFDAEWHCIPAAAIGAPHIRDRLFILGYANGGRWAARQQTRKATRHGVSSSPTSSNARAMANTNSQGLPIWNELGNGFETTATMFSRSELERVLTTTGRQQWEVEPAVGRVADGISFGLERFGGLSDVEQSSDPKAFAEGSKFAWQVLREVWEHRKIAATSPELFVQRMRHLVPDVSCAIGLRKWIKKASSDEELHSVWEAIYSMPFEKTQQLQQRMLERAREEECSQALGLKKTRADRLKGLGNAVVPQVAEYIGRTILKAAR